jgi:hypothetical protein
MRSSLFTNVRHTILHRSPSYPDSLIPLFPLADVRLVFAMKATCWPNRPTPPLSPSAGAMHSTYAHYMLLPDTAPSCYTLRLQPHMIYSDLRFCLGTHHLPNRSMVCGQVGQAGRGRLAQMLYTLHMFLVCNVFAASAETVLPERNNTWFLNVRTCRSCISFCTYALPTCR